MTRHPRRAAGLTAAAVAVGALAGGLAAATPAAAAESSQVYVVHGVPGLDVDVYVNGKRTLQGFEPTSVAGPLTLPAGTYRVAIREAGSAAGSAPAISRSVRLPGGVSASLVAHLTAGGEPTLSTFVNPLGGLAAGQARVVVRHTAAAPAVDVLAGGEPVISGLTNPDQKMLDVPAGTVPAAVALAGTTKPVLGPARLDLGAGTVTVVYAIGSAQDGTLDLVTQSLRAGGSATPSGADAGSGGLAAEPSPGRAPALLLVTGLVVLAVGGAGLAVGRRR